MRYSLYQAMKTSIAAGIEAYGSSPQRPKQKPVHGRTVVLVAYVHSNWKLIAPEVMQWKSIIASSIH